MTGVIILAITIFMGEDDLRTTVTAFWASVVVLLVLVVLIYLVEHWAMAQGFGLEDSDDLEGMSTAIGISYL
ncbi:YibE/F family protein, partial [Shewanella sp. C31]|nr:YibE/F family protein [Shewanella electrica]